MILSYVLRVGKMFFVEQIDPDIPERPWPDDEPPEDELR